MSATLRHFAINADNVSRARDFYETVFGWTFTPWGPPGFYQTRDAGDGLMGALQERRNWGSKKLHSFETTFGVEDIRAALAAVGLPPATPPAVAPGSARRTARRAAGPRPRGRDGARVG